MNIKSMRMRSYRSFKVDDADLPAPARERLLAIRRFGELRAEVHPPAPRPPPVVQAERREGRH